MGDPHPAGRTMNGQSGRSTTREPGVLGYCLVTGVFASAAGAGASLLGGNLWVRLATWVTVLVAVTVGAGWWWVRSPVRARRWTVGLLVPSATRDAPTRKA
ncbi:hypothetical protein GCM10011578_081440 [Streptomyces fuscichromogenes]|uniref:Uncharacterized protein n=1 Tax=Streptomyces fuscichromogenes TaxID=1324013 RepID=A0A918CVY7_9ACTN|nr:hypothetical protein GCM10011578_081440 [Streptomyces fuscichromogenes]